MRYFAMTLALIIMVSMTNTTQADDRPVTKCVPIAAPRPAPPPVITERRIVEEKRVYVQQCAPRHEYKPPVVLDFNIGYNSGGYYNGGGYAGCNPGYGGYNQPYYQDSIQRAGNAYMQDYYRAVEYQHSGGGYYNGGGYYGGGGYGGGNGGNRGSVNIGFGVQIPIGGSHGHSHGGGHHH